MLFCLEFSAKLLSFFIALILFVYFAYKSIGIWSILILPILSIIIFIVNYFNTKAKSLRKVRRKYELIEFGQFAKIVTARNEILFAGKLDDELQKLHIPLMDQKFRWIKVVTMGWAMTTIPFAVFYFSQAGILGFAIDGVRIWTFSLATLSTLILLYWYFNTTLNTLIWAYRQWTDHLVKVFSLWEVMKKMKKTSYFQQDFTYKHGHVEIKNLNYRYENNLVLKDISLEIEGWKMYAFVWPSGGGKSTLLKIIAGYQLPDEASVFIDDQDIRFLAPISYFSNVWYLSQDPWVFEGTILENLQYAVSYELSDEEIQIALQKAGSEFVYELPDGINTYVGERWVLLSGWQKQRLAIAKLFLKNPKILLMDEPTSALDSVSEETIWNSFKELFKDKTVIIVAHRLQTVRQADCIFVIEGWQIVESGTHEELVLKEWVYKKMIELQTRF